MKNEIRKIHAIDTEVNFGVYENTLESICYKHLEIEKQMGQHIPVH